ncbi:MAG: type I secretion system permease/ATPase [Candidatus Sedimenticola sp. (ex Thyasira tokunagai)]
MGVKGSNSEGVEDIDPSADITNEKVPQEESIDTGLACLVLMARFHGLSADAKQIERQFTDGTPLSGLMLLRAAKRLGLKAKQSTIKWQQLDTTPLPAIAKNKNGQYFVLAKVDNDTILIQDPAAGRPQTLNEETFLERWSGSLIYFTKRLGNPTTGHNFDFTWFIPSLVKYRRLFGEVLLASLFLQLFALVTPLFFQVVIDKVLVHRGLTTLDVLAIGMIIISVFDVVIGGMRTYLFSHTANRVDVELGAKLYQHLTALPLGWFKARRVGDSVARVRELETIRNFITGSALTLIIDLSFTIVFFVVMYYYSPTLTYIVLGAIPFYILLSIFVTPILRSRLHEKFNRGAENQAFLVESVSGAETIKAMAVEPQMQQRWEAQLAAYIRAAFKSANLGNIASQTASLINKITVVLILWIGARLVINGELSVGQLVAFNMLAGRVSGPILKLVQLWQDFQQASISVQRLGDILNTKPEPQYSPNRASLPELKGHVSFEHVGFRYRPDAPSVLNDVNLTVKAGDIVGIVGRSGSGKSTIAKLIQRLYVPENGRVLVDGVDLAQVEPGWLRRNVGVVLQESILFNSSIRDNIALTEPGMPMERVIAAATASGAHEFILEMAEGYDTIVGEQGSTLSGGQRQRVAIARALATNPRILIFDEATSALDYESERIIQQNMRTICRGRTVILIAHRLSTLREASHILVLEKGRVSEQGSHEELIEKGGQYAHLHALQVGGPVPVGKQQVQVTG